MNREKTKNNIEYLPKENIWINPKVAIHLSDETIKTEIPWDSINRKEFQEVYKSHFPTGSREKQGS